MKYMAKRGKMVVKKWVFRGKKWVFGVEKTRVGNHNLYLQPIITQYFIDNKSEIWLLFLIAHSKR